MTRTQTILVAEEHSATRNFLIVILGCGASVIDVANALWISAVLGVILGASFVSSVPLM